MRIEPSLVRNSFLKKTFIRYTLTRFRRWYYYVLSFYNTFRFARRVILYKPDDCLLFGQKCYFCCSVSIHQLRLQRKKESYTVAIPFLKKKTPKMQNNIKYEVRSTYRWHVLGPWHAPSLPQITNYYNRRHSQLVHPYYIICIY